MNLTELLNQINLRSIVPPVPNPNTDYFDNYQCRITLSPILLTSQDIYILYFLSDLQSNFYRNEKLWNKLFERTSCRQYQDCGGANYKLINVMFANFGSFISKRLLSVFFDQRSEISDASIGRSFWRRYYPWRTLVSDQ